MARPSDIQTKAIATRIPMEEYIRILKEASSKGQSLSEWLQIKIFGSIDKKAAEASNKELREAKAKIKDLTTQLKKKPQTVTKEVIKKDTKLEKEVKELRASQDKAVKLSVKRKNELDTQIKQYEAWAKQMQSNEKSIEKELQQKNKQIIDLKQEIQGLKNRIDTANKIIAKEGFKIGSGFLNEGEQFTV